VVLRGAHGGLGALELGRRRPPGPGRREALLGDIHRQGPGGPEHHEGVPDPVALEAHVGLLHLALHADAPREGRVHELGVVVRLRRGLPEGRRGVGGVGHGRQPVGKSALAKREARR
ncbi:MAG: hypothetical protein ACK55I_49630, partial [bacterium]